MGEVISLVDNLRAHIEELQSERHELELQMKRLRDEAYRTKHDMAGLDSEIAWLKRKLMRVQGTFNEFNF